MSMNTKDEIVETKSAVMVPDIKQTKASIEAFDQLKNNLLELGKDKVVIGDKLAITRAGFSKIALAFNISTSIVKIERTNTDSDYIVYAVARATAPNGRYAEGNASCSASEFTNKIQATIHNVDSKAVTRATNRSIANLVGGGILSKEELTADDDEEKPKEDVPITPKQMSYIKKLMEEKGYIVATGIHGKQIEALTKSEAHAIIEELQGKKG